VDLVEGFGEMCVIRELGLPEEVRESVRESRRTSGEHARPRVFRTLR
jgi:hypothetical protein